MSDVNAGAPLGAEPVVSSGSNSTSTPNTPSVSSEPSFVEIKEDGLYKFPGQDKPVKPSDYVRGFQSQATKASQRAAELERKLQEREAAIQRYEADRTRQAQTQRQDNNPANDVLANLESMPYLSGQDAATVVRSIAQEFNGRDQITIAILKQLQAIQQVVKPLYETNATSQFEGKISGWLREGNYPEEYKDLATELYLGYEPGPELDREFPRILQERIAQVESALDKKRKAAAEQARRAPFVPGRGGVSHPSKPLSLDPRNSARADADAIWDAIQIGSGT